MIVTGADSGIGCAVAIVFAKDGAEVSIVYLEEQEYAEEMRRSVGPRERPPGRCGQQRGRAVRGVDAREITERQPERTFRTNIFAVFG